MCLSDNSYNGDAAATLQLLIDKGADPEACDDHGETALHHAAEYESGENTAFLLRCVDREKRNNEGRTALFYAASEGSATMVETFYDAGADFEVHDQCGETPFFAAAAGNNLATAKVLVRHGVDMLARNHEGKNALHAAAVTRAMAVASYMVTEGAIQDKTRDTGRLDIAFRSSAKGVPPALHELIEHLPAVSP